MFFNIKITIRYTNWQSKLTAKFVEKNFNDSLLITKETRNSYSKFYAPFNSSAILYYVNKTNANQLEHDCHGELNTQEQNIYEIPPNFKKFFGLGDFARYFINFLCICINLS